MKVNIGFLGGLFFLFLGLELGHVIDWPWYWVAAPLWLPVAVLVALLGLVAAGMLVAVAVLALVKLAHQRYK